MRAKKLTTSLICLFVVTTLFCVLNACNKGGGYTGTYYAYENGVKNETQTPNTVYF